MLDIPDIPDRYPRKCMWSPASPQTTSSRDFLPLFLILKIWVFDIDGIISPLYITFEGLFTIHFNRNNEEKKKRGEMFVTNKWFKSYG